MSRKKVMNNPVIVSFKIKKSEKEMIDAYAEENDLTLSQIIRKSLRFYLETEGIDFEDLE